MPRPIFFVYLLIFVPFFVTAQESQLRDLTGFDRIRVEGDIDASIELTDSGVYRIEVFTDGNDLSTLRTRLSGVDNQTLIVDLKTSGRNEDYSVAIQLPMLRSLAVQGSGSARLSNVLAEDFEISLSGSGEIGTEDIDVEDLALSLAGSGELNMASVRAESAELKIAGSGDTRIDDLQVAELRVQIAGSGDVSLAGEVSDASISIAGSGDINGEGLRVENLNGVIAGSGDVNVDVIGNNRIRRLGADTGLSDILDMGLDIGSLLDELELSDETEIDLDLDFGGRRDAESSLQGVFAVLLVFLAPVAVVALVVIYRYRKKRLEHETLRQLAEQNQPIPDSAWAAFDTGRTPLQSGVRLIAIGLGLIVFFLVAGTVEGAAIGSIPLFIGVAKLIAWKLEDQSS